MPGTNIYGELIRAQLQNSASDLASAVAGLVYYNTTTPGIKYYNGAWRTVANLEAAQTFLGKTTLTLAGYISETATVTTGTLTPASTPPKAVQRVTTASATLGAIVNTEGALTTQLVIVNATSSSISVLNDQGASSSIITGTGGNITLAAGASIIVLYDATSLRWRVVGGSGSGGSATEVVTQASHGFLAGGFEAVYSNAGTYTKAIATAANTSSVVGIVSRVQSTSVFEFTSSGKVSGLTGLTVGADYFLSATTPGAITNVEPTTTGYVSQPIGIALSATELLVAIKRGVVIGTSNVFTTITLANTAATTIQNISSFANGEGGVLTGVFRIDATTDYVFGFEISFTKDIAGVINHSVRYFAGDVLPGISVTVSGQNIQVTLGTLAGFVSASARFQLAASAVSPGLQISATNVTGSTTGTAPGAGLIGEKVEGVQPASTNFGGTGVWLDAASISLSPGVWMIGVVGAGILNGSTCPEVGFGVSTTSGNSSSGLTFGTNWAGGAGPTASANITYAIPSVIANVSTTTTYYLKAVAFYSAGTPQYRGRITAIRIA